jgi:DNA-binding transcriptional ArsR family regulator
MRPLFHPSIEDVTVEGIMHALSDPVRVAIYADIVGSQCSQTCSELQKIAEKPIPRSTLSQHFKALREAGLVRGERVGVEMRNTSRCSDIEKRFPGLIPAIVKAHKIQLAQNPPRLGGAGRAGSKGAARGKSHRRTRRAPKKP